MFKIKKFIALLFSGLFSTSFLASCSSNNNTLDFYLSNGIDNQTAKQYVKLIQDEYNKKFTNNQIAIRAINLNNNQAKLNRLLNNSAAFVFLNSKSVIDNKLYESHTVKLQTLTKQFVFSNSTDRYINGTESDPLRITARAMNELSFDKKPFNEWTDEEFKWNKTAYEAFYSSELTPTYRGMILLGGSKDNIEKAKKAWNDKDWKSFKDLGIITGNNNSAGVYLLQEKLLKKHFNKQDNTFTTLAEEKLKEPNKFGLDEYGTSLIGKTNQYTIGFSDEGSFVWTHNDKSNNHFYIKDENSAIEALIVTETSFYDLGVFNKALDKNLVNELSKIMYELSVQTKDTYLHGLGYYGLSEIKDINQELLIPYQTTWS